MAINKKESECCGCTACMTICPKKAINMHENTKGFQMPIVDGEKCIECGLCEKVCSYDKNRKIIESVNEEVYAIKRKNEEDRKESQSGGAFSSIAQYILSNNGIVYGVKCDKYNAYYTRITSTDELKILKGSKYVQAEVQETFKQVLSDLNEKKNIVLFSGTSCHIDGLISFLKQRNINTENLITCDLICHGVPSPKIFREYYKHIENKYGEISDFNFRNKEVSGWHGHIITFKNEYNNMVISNNYVNIFYSNLELRECCYSCPYSTKERISDITIGDFWGIEKYHKEFDDNKGCSVMILNTEKARSIFENIKSDLLYIKSNSDECIQPNLQHPTEKPVEYDVFWDYYINNGFIDAVTKFCKFNDKNDFTYTFINRFKRKVGKILIKFIK
ncbi:MAG: Coenzyme F420 hydrogenase/dehydrogenase, beta subunit C-terminal domain [Clostridium butyricum]|uniref:Coenzyme F420 hydrogenase/dehydrogenase, beta subunit C-terminal domain n=1 Tax=Clostridium butyricum TaxID=1492 RepID=UPI002903EB7E|nr:Coenzyme F420 hydrogenase/dehydrogenase, beta subunit C-terminal domain [Clostridium butyricum]MDU3582835.1 Coenzyme F420 hydrogenase/dehydrogenase, beta subunit C-terminal domain [Clostridium butyricum]MDU3595952.1 Coenzyme F420 hydrogenase/dehydrogenase, beta subunit C-terminal domain [Clostridium butyricum]